MSFTLSTIYKAIDKYSPVLKKMSSATSNFALNAEAGINRANRSIKSIQKVTGGAVSGIMNLRNAAIVTGAVMVTKKVWDYSQAIAKVGDEAANTARMLGISAEALQELQFAGDIQNVTSESLITSLKFLNKNVGALKAGTGGLYTILKKTNPELAKQLKNAKTNEEAFNLITNAIQKLPTQFEKSALAQAAFGRGGIDMLKMTDIGVAGINKLREEARRYGGVMSNEVAGQMDEYLDTQARMKMAMQGLKVQIMTGLIPVLQKTATNITNWIGNNKELLKAKIAEWADKISASLQFLARNFTTIVRIAKWGISVFAGLWAVNIALKAVSASMMILKGIFIAFNVAQGIYYAFQSAIPIALTASSAAMKAYSITTGLASGVTWLFNAALWACPLTWIVIAIAAVVAAIVLLIVKWKEVVHWFKTSNSFFAKFLRAIIYPLIIAFKAIGQAVRWLWGKLKEFSNWFVNTKVFKFMVKMIQPVVAVFRALGQALSWVWDKIKAVWDFLKRTGKAALEPIMKLIDKFSAGTQAELNVNTKETPVNVQKASNEGVTNRYEEINKQQIEIMLNNKSDKKANINTNTAKIPVIGATR